MSDATRAAIAVTLLGDDAEARRLCLAWPSVDHKLTARALHLAWGRRAGVAASRVARIAPALLGQGLCREDGTVDPEATRVLQHVAAERLRGRPGRGIR